MNAFTRNTPRSGALLLRLLFAVLAALLLGALTAVPALADSGTWTLTGSMNTARVFHMMTLLQNGQVLVAGGRGSNGRPLASAELFDPATGTWTLTGSMDTARESATATLLPNGRVLVAGGLDLDLIGNPIVLASAELFDPATGTWTLTGSLNVARFDHTATLLPSGQVLVAGGATFSPGRDALASAELFNPATGTWTPTGSMNFARASHTATLLPSGQVLVAGPGTSAELFTP